VVPKLSGDDEDETAEQSEYDRPENDVISARFHFPVILAANSGGWQAV
jgi:hypothetical protein